MSGITSVDMSDFDCYSENRHKTSEGQSIQQTRTPNCPLQPNTTDGKLNSGSEEETVVP
jgi:hypothetical protein